MLEQSRITVEDVDHLCLKHQVGAMAEDVDCIACFEAERHDATIDAYAVEAERTEVQNADLERRLERARKALAGSIVVMEAYFTEQGRDACNNDNYCNAVDVLAQLGAPVELGESGDTPLETARGALLASKKFLLALSARGFEWSDANPMGSAVINYCELALARIGAPLAPREDDEPHPEFIRGYLKAADDLAEPYPTDVSFFAPLTDEQIKTAVEAMGGDISGRLHAHWARHWADVLRKRSAEK